MNSAPPARGTLQDAINENRQRLVELLKKGSPEKTALILEKEGWSREWACKAVQTIETRHNPSNLVHGPKHNQQIRERLQTHAGIGACLFTIGFLVTTLSLISAFSSGGWIIIAYGSIFAGAGMFLKSFPQLKRYPDRKPPLFLPPKDSGDGSPQDY